ncbi:hypothetical protein ACIQU6_30800 [Streptomyces sp. NPDC090442]|uniref:hypothetical protein n=1 Tax=Streptomyces sp. NPDC090442 TaxID=3365962 RepID=UPI003814A09D
MTTDYALTVPYIALWSAEQDLAPRRWVRRGEDGERLGYVDETLYDRDRFGALWARWSSARGKGRPQLQDVHPFRQRRAVLQELCQVCGKPALAAGRYLYLFTKASAPIYEGRLTSTPPICTTCAPTVVEECPHLQRGYVAVWAERAPLWGVQGIRYHPRTRLPRPEDDGEFVSVEYGAAPELPWIVAYRQVVSLHGLTPVTDIAAVSTAESLP